MDVGEIRSTFYEIWAKKLKWPPCFYTVLGTVRGLQRPTSDVLLYGALSCKTRQAKQNIQPEDLEAKF